MSADKDSHPILSRDAYRKRIQETLTDIDGVHDVEFDVSVAGPDEFCVVMDSSLDDQAFQDLKYRFKRDFRSDSLSIRMVKRGELTNNGRIRPVFKISGPNASGTSTPSAEPDDPDGPDPDGAGQTVSESGMSDKWDDVKDKFGFGSPDLDDDDDDDDKEDIESGEGLGELFG